MVRFKRGLPRCVVGMEATGGAQYWARQLAPDERSRGQTFAEYALILGALAVVGYASYTINGNSIASLASGVFSALTSA